jgi:hypothetical protein
MLCYYVLLCYMLKFVKFPSVAATTIAAAAAVVAAAIAASMSCRN